MDNVVSIADAADRQYEARLVACMQDFRRYMYQTAVDHGLDRVDALALLADEATFWLADASHSNETAHGVLRDIVDRSIAEMADNEDD